MRRSRLSSLTATAGLLILLVAAAFHGMQSGAAGPGGRTELAPPPAELLELNPGRGADPVDSTRGFAYDFAPGKRFVYEFRLESRSRLAFGSDAASPPEIGVRVDGSISFEGCAADATEFLVRVDFRKSRIEAAPGTGDETREHLATLAPLSDATLLLRVDRTGRFLGIRFGDALPVEARNFARMVLHSFRHLASPEGRRRYERTEADLNCEHSTRYELDLGTPGIVRSKREKVDPRPHRSRMLGGDLDPEILLRSEAHAELDRLAGAWREIRSEETVELLGKALGFEGYASTDVTARLTRLEVGSMSGGEDPSDWEGAWASPDLPDELPAATGGIAPRYRDVALFVVAFRASGLEGLRTTTTGEQTMLLAELAVLLSSDDRLCRDAEAILHASTTEPLLARMISQALAQAATAAAQSALARALEDGTLRDENRSMMLLSCFSVVRPDDTLIRATASAARAGSSVDSVRTALLVTGALASAAGGPAGARGVLALLDVEDDMRTRSMTREWLAALGNSRSSAASERAVPYLLSRDRAERLTAIRAVASDRAEAHLRLIADLARQERSYQIRERCVGVLAEGWNSHGREEILRILAEEPPGDLRDLCLAKARTHVNEDDAARVAVDRLNR